MMTAVPPWKRSLLGIIDVALLSETYFADIKHVSFILRGKELLICVFVVTNAVFFIFVLGKYSITP